MVGVVRAEWSLLHIVIILSMTTTAVLDADRVIVNTVTTDCPTLYVLSVL